MSIEEATALVENLSDEEVLRLKAFLDQLDKEKANSQLSDEE